MTAGTFVVGTKLSAASAAGNAVLCRPRNSCCIVGITCHIAEFRAADNCGTSRCAVQERHTLCTGTGVFGIELSVAGAAGNSLFHRPCNCLSIVAVRRDIGEAAHALGFRRTGRTPKECDDLRAGADAVGVEGGGVGAGGNALVHSPDHGVLIIAAGGNVSKGVLAGGLLSLELALHGDLACGHGEGILAVLLGQLDLLVLAVQNGEGIQHIALVGIDRQGDGGVTAGLFALRGLLAEGVLGGLNGALEVGETVGFLVSGGAPFKVGVAKRLFRAAGLALFPVARLVILDGIHTLVGGEGAVIDMPGGLAGAGLDARILVGRLLLYHPAAENVILGLGTGLFGGAADAAGDVDVGKGDAVTNGTVGIVEYDFYGISM